MSWNPAVPPPPVAGASTGSGLADGRRDGDRCRAGDGRRAGEERRVGDGLGVAVALAVGLALALGVVALAVPLGRVVGVAELVPEGENVVGVAEGEDAVQAETDAEARIARVTQPAPVSLAPSALPAIVARIFTGPPHASGNGRTCFPVPASEEKSRTGPGRCPRRSKAAPGGAGGHKGKAHGRHRHQMACSSLE
jgi:hypothetical protein